SDLTKVNAYFVRPILDGKEQPPAAPFKLAANAPPYISIPLRTPEGYAPNDASVGDLDGDGEFEIILHQAARGKDNSQTGVTGEPPRTHVYCPARAKVADWGVNYGNRVDRFLACVAYLDGVHPSVVFCRGYYTRTVLAAWDWRDGKLTSRWVFDTDSDPALRA